MFHGSISADIAQGLKVLRSRIEAARIPSSKLDETLNLATWNIREFGRAKRSEPAIHYIAEILGQFDLISVVELRKDLADLSRVLKILGPYWRVVYSDMIPDDGGNEERIAFLYDKRAIVFTGMAAGAVPPRRKDAQEYLTDFQWWRPPYMASFRAGNFDFVIITAHIRWGESSGRLREIQSFADWLEAKRQGDQLCDNDLIVTGDFNLETKTMTKALCSRGLMVPKALTADDPGATLVSGKRYDQILHLPQFPENFMNKGGVLDFFAGDSTALFPALTREKFTYQISDHFPLWVQINTDIDGQLLDQAIQAGKMKTAKAR